eukprot:GFYU01000772.1.p1 GENE.GFYU01000772.1~~GFYU01000772.1.p1  ORF type:complete len:576 (-),score=169.02 GFYU01000772.1:777-2504(-)
MASPKLGHHALHRPYGPNQKQKLFIIAGLFMMNFLFFMFRASEKLDEGVPTKDMCNGLNRRIQNLDGSTGGKTYMPGFEHPVNFPLEPKVAYVTRNLFSVKPVLLKRGFIVKNRYSKNPFSFVWSSSKRYKTLNYYKIMKPGKMLWKHEDNLRQLSNKRRIYINIKQYLKKYPQCDFEVGRIMPETFDMSDKGECTTFFERHAGLPEDTRSNWFWKNPNLDKGLGVKLMTHQEVPDLYEEYGFTRETMECEERDQAHVLMQSQITGPLLVNQRKFDLRVFLLVASFKPLVMYYRDGYLRTSLVPYNETSTDQFVQLTNVAMVERMKKSNMMNQQTADAGQADAEAPGEVESPETADTETDHESEGEVESENETENDAEGAEGVDGGELEAPPEGAISEGDSSTEEDPEEQVEGGDHGNILSMSQFLNAFSLEEQQAYTMVRKIKRRIKQIMLLSMMSVFDKIGDRNGAYDLIGFDFMIDHNYDVWLIEANVDPGLKISSDVDKDLKLDLIEEVLDVVFEVAERKQKGYNLQAQSAETFELLFDESSVPHHSVVDGECIQGLLDKRRKKKKKKSSR